MSFFFFQAEDGIRDYKVTGVQTCALPIYYRGGPDRRGRAGRRDRAGRRGGAGTLNRPARGRHRLVDLLGFTPLAHRPPLPRRGWVHCATAYLSPSLVLALVAAPEVPYPDLVSLLTLVRSEEHTSELQSPCNLVCRLLLEKK